MTASLLTQPLLWMAALFFLCLLVIVAVLWVLHGQLREKFLGQSSELQLALMSQVGGLKQQTSEHQLQGLKFLQDTLRETLGSLEKQLQIGSLRQIETLQQHAEKISFTLAQQLAAITEKVDKRLNDGFEKTSATFTDIVKRLALIDDAQKKLSDLSSNVINLQEILADKRSRGAFGEVQLKNLIENILNKEHFALQHTLKNGCRADCILFLPEPTGHLVIDSKFPLENYQKMMTFNASEPERKKAQQDFKQDIKKHISDVASKYIIPGETADGVVLFIPAEAVFAEIHGHFPELVQIAQRASVWLASPTTIMAIVTTAQAVLKDSATKQHIIILRDHLKILADDFMRFQERMDKLAKHIDQAQEDVRQVHTSAKKISSRFILLEKGDLALITETVD